MSEPCGGKKRTDSRRRRLDAYVSSGNLRQRLEGYPGGPDFDVIDLLVDLAIRYCEPRRKPRKVRGTGVGRG